MKYWQEDFKKIKEKILPELKEIVEGLEGESEIKDGMGKLIQLLSQTSPNEFELAKGLSKVAGLFSDNRGESVQAAEEFVSNMKLFYKNAQVAELLTQKRLDLCKKMTPEEKRQHDLKLFEVEGMMYCLEYYLMFYKLIQRASTEAEKRKVIESYEVESETGKLPGLWFDFTRDEVPINFIYNVFDDDLRGKLLDAYFGTKREFMKINMICDKQDVCEAKYGGASLEKIINSFRSLLLIFLDVFDTIGIKQLKSYFLTPYGEKPLIKTIKL